jgi:hypothetical protein
MSEKETIEVFLQGEGIAEVQLVKVSLDLTVRELIEKARTIGTVSECEGAVPILLVEDSDEELKPESKLAEAGIGHRHRVHCHRCRRIEVTVNYNGEHRSHSFSPSTTVRKVKRWADDEFKLKGVDATEHALQICGTNKRPDEDVHIGSLAEFPNCKLCFDLVPKKRVEG